MAGGLPDAVMRVVGFAISSDKVRVISGFRILVQWQTPFVLSDTGQKAPASGAPAKSRGCAYQNCRYRPVKISGRAGSL